jgi:hypothetical protein
MTRRSAALATAAAAALAAAAIPVASGGAQDTSTAVRTITVKFKATGGNSYFADVAPKSPKGPPRVSIGDRFVGIQSVTFDGRPGTLHTDSVITNRTPAGFERFTAILHSVLHLADGDIYATGFVDSAGKGDRSEIVGGSGA